MNKSTFIKKLSEKLNRTLEECSIIDEILEENFIIGKKNKEKIMIDLTNKLQIDSEMADEIYNTAMEIISKEIKNKMKNPFKSQD